MTELFAGVFIASISYWSGFLIGRRARKGQIRAICLCGHHIGEHEDKTGRCNATKDGPKAEHQTPGTGRVLTWKQVPCTCVSYSGPELISMFTGREIADS